NLTTRKTLEPWENVERPLESRWRVPMKWNSSMFLQTNLTIRKTLEPWENVERPLGFRWRVPMKWNSSIVVERTINQEEFTEAGAHRLYDHELRTYLEWLSEIPWSKGTFDTLDIYKTRSQLEEDNYGLETRILWPMIQQNWQSLKQSRTHPDALFDSDSGSQQVLSFLDSESETQELPSPPETREISLLGPA
ncbi:1929_t:CDS:2, partial [Gigaspora rosea]